MQDSGDHLHFYAGNLGREMPETKCSEAEMIVLQAHVVERARILTFKVPVWWKLRT